MAESGNFIDIFGSCCATNLVVGSRFGTMEAGVVAGKGGVVGVVRVFALKTLSRSHFSSATGPERMAQCQLPAVAQAAGPAFLTAGDTSHASSRQPHQIPDMLSNLHAAGRHVGFLSSVTDTPCGLLATSSSVRICRHRMPRCLHTASTHASASSPPPTSTLLPWNG
jgi:hypothetical protein